jgi:hypothetical protein
MVDAMCSILTIDVNSVRVHEQRDMCELGVIHAKTSAWEVCSKEVCSREVCSREVCSREVCSRDLFDTQYMGGYA